MPSTLAFHDPANRWTRDLKTLGQSLLAAYSGFIFQPQPSHDRRCIPVVVAHARVDEHLGVDYLAEPGQLAEAMPGQLVLSAPTSSDANPALS
jgi:hypothetical protein